MKHWTEDMIRERLDGTFTRVHYDGKIVVEAVDDNYSPGMSTVGRKPGATSKPQVAWTAAEDELLCQMRAKGRPFNEISWLLARSEESAKKRFRMLRVKGQVAA